MYYLKRTQGGREISYQMSTTLTGLCPEQDLRTQYKTRKTLERISIFEPLTLPSRVCKSKKLGLNQSHYLNLGIAISDADVLSTTLTITHPQDSRSSDPAHKWVSFYRKISITLHNIIICANCSTGIVIFSHSQKNHNHLFYVFTSGSDNYWIIELS